MYKCTFTEQEFTNVDLLISNYKVAMLEFWPLWLSIWNNSRVGMEAHDHQNMQFFQSTFLESSICLESRTYCSQAQLLAHDGFLG